MPTLFSRLTFRFLIILSTLIHTLDALSSDKPACSSETIHSPAGAVCGVTQSPTPNKQANAFLGIPYAESTAGKNRWRAPIAKSPWSNTYHATEFGAICPQLGASNQLSQSEDCLSINIWTPKSVSKQTKLPVMVFIYGGAFSSGYSSDPLYDGVYIAALKDVVLVSFNYRVGVLGFLAADGLTGNYGFLDQQLALEWVKDNIASFGGDADKVTLFGESAGAMSVGLHVFSAPNSQHLFRAAIMESNFLGLPYKSLTDQINVGNQFKQGLNCRDLACLQNMDVATLLNAESQFTPQMSTVFTGAKFYLPFSPVIDGQVLTHQPTSLSSQQHNHKPVIIGTNKDEAVLLVGNQTITPAWYSAWAANLYGLSFQRVIERYPAQFDSGNQTVWATVQTDNFLLCSTRYLASHMTAPVYIYLFNHQPSVNFLGLPACAENDNVCHAAELPFVFHSAENKGFQFTEQEQVLSNQIIDYWTNFAKYLTPNAQPQTPALINWPAFTEHKKAYLALNTEALSVEQDPYQTTCEFWDSIGYEIIHPWQNAALNNH